MFSLNKGEKSDEEMQNIDGMRACEFIIICGSLRELENLFVYE